MRKCSSSCGWRLSTGVATIGALAMSVAAVAGALPVTVTKSSVSEAPGPQQGVKVITVISDQEKARGSASAAGGGEAIVYKNTNDIGNFTVRGQRFNYAPQVSAGATNDLGFDLSIGTFIADDMFFGGGWTAGTPISSFSAFVRRSGGDFTRGIGDGTANATVTLWDGDPMNQEDTTGDGFASAPIASCSFTLDPQFGFGTLQNLKCNLATPVVPPHNVVWMVLTSVPDANSPSSCRLFWPLDLQTATIGASRDEAQIGQDDDTAAIGSFGGPSTSPTDGTCCDSGAPCGPTTGDTCDGNPANGAGRCSDGDAETHLFFNFGGPCVGDPNTDSCVNYLAQINSPAATAISLVPIGGAGNIGISGNEISYTAGGGTVSLEVRIGNWDPNATGTLLKAWQTGVAVAGYTSALQGTLTARSVACTTAADCLPGGAAGADFTGVCSIGGNSCSTDGDCAFAGPPLNETCGGLKCDLRFSSDPAGSEVCLPAYILSARSDYVFNGQSELPATDLSDPSGFFRWASALNAVPSIAPPSPFPAGDLYAASLQLDISSNAKGTFTLGLVDVPDSVLVDDNSLFIPLLGLVPAQITIETGQCCDLSAQPFVCLSDTVTVAECDTLGGLFDATKTCADDCGCLTDAQCADGDACTTDRCVASACVNTPVTVPTNSCCDSTVGDDVNGGGTVASADDSNECTIDSCSNGGTSGTVVNDAAAADGNACDAPLLCKSAFCNAGVCVSGEVQGAACASDQECIDLNGGRTAGNPACTPAGTCDCVSCFTNLAITDPNACRAGVSMVGPTVCAEEGDKVTMAVHRDASIRTITGGQFTIQWDPTCLSFNSVGVGAAPYDFLVNKDTSNAANGSVFIATGVNPFGGVGTGDAADMATISFTKIGSCNWCDVSLGGVNPSETLLTDTDGQAIFADPLTPAAVHDCDLVTIDCPGDQSANADCDFPTAIVTWPGITGSSDCGNAVDVVCTARHQSGLDLSDRALSGGEFPIGDTTVNCTATSTTGSSDSCTFTVSVADATALDVTVQLSPVLSAPAMTRCIKFELFSDCVQPPLVFSKTMTFGGLFDNVGHFTDSIKIPSSGQFVCITARDQLHSLRACDFLTCSGGAYHATFKGDPFFGGNWLINGNLDGWKKDNPNASHDVIDILDFGQFVSQFGNAQGGVNTDCNTPGPHADINGDGIVDALDFAFVSQNFLSSSKACCCGSAASLGNTVARTEISVRDLRAMGMADLATADLNNDGVVNADDMSAFLAGDRPAKKAPVKGRAGGTVRSR